jgi:hypothetical protein
MGSHHTRHAYAVFVLLVSILGLVISTSILERTTHPPTELGGARILVWFSYGFICLVGILSVFLPGPCSRTVGIRRSPEEHLEGYSVRATRVFGVFLLHGHHSPSEDIGATRELQFRGKNFCASCFGLLTGAIVSLIAISVYLLSGWKDGYLAWFVYFLGVTAVALGFASTLLEMGARTKFLLGIIFIAGTSFMLIASDAVAASLTADFLVMLLAVFWLLSRISLSHRN